MRIAVIDIGTNTFNLLIRDTASQELLFSTKISVKLGKGGINSNVITSAAFDRGINALIEHKATIQKWNVDKTYAFATSAVRTAQNGKQFVQTALEKTDIKVNIIDGNQEAELIYLGVKQNVNLKEQNSLIVDIGGGSTEFIIANKRNLIWKKSYRLGSSRLMEKFIPSDPISLKEIKEIQNYFDQELQDLFTAVQQNPVKELIGSSGSFNTLADMIIARFQTKDSPITKTNYQYNIDQYKAISDLMLTSNYEKRLNTPGMISMRADIMGMACILINHILKRVEIKEMRLSTYALKEGVFTTLNSGSTWQESLL